MAYRRRIQKIAQLLQEETAKMLDREAEFPEGTLVTVTRVSVSEDGLYADIFLSVLGGDAKHILAITQKSVYHIQQILNRRLRMRPVPKIRFTIDEEEIKRQGVEKSLAELKRDGGI